MKKLILFCGLIFLLFPFLTSELAAQSKGTLTLEKGTIKLRRDFDDRFYQEAGKEIPIQYGDEIQTGKDTRALLFFTEQQNTVNLFSNTFFVISEVEQEADNVFMPIGKAHFTVKKIKPIQKNKKRFRLRTANALIGVKGTEFVVGVGDGDTSLLTLSGSVSLANIEAPDVEVTVQVNQASQIQQSSTPTSPVVIPPAVQQSIITGDSAQSFNEVQFGEVIGDTKTQKEEETKEKKKSQTSDSKDDETKSGTEEGETADAGPEISEIDETLESVIEDVEEVQEEAQESADEQTNTIKLRIVRP